MSALTLAVRPFPSQRCQIRYDRRQVSLMALVASCEGIHQFAMKSGTTVKQIRAIAAGRKAPTPGVLEYFDLQKNGDGFVWNFQAQEAGTVNHGKS